MNVRSITLLTTMALLASPLFALKMDETTHDEIIKRLELGVDDMDKDAPERTGILGRLAELYADRARLKAMSEVERKCEKCVGAKSDRAHAIDLYNQILPKVEKDAQGRVVLQLAHLHALNDQAKKAESLYQDILKSKRGRYSSEVRAIAEASVAEIYFRKGEFKPALSHFEAARREQVKNKALVEYRIAWSQLNLGQTDQAIKTLVHLLKSPDLLATQSQDGEHVDPSFVADASRDLARFLARAKVGPSQLDLLKSLSPDKERKTNLYTLANETDRLGKKNEALIVWAAYVDEGDVQPNEKLEVQIRVARIFYDLGKQDLATAAYEKALGLWKKNGCQNNEELCTELKSRLRQMVTAMNKAQKQKLTKNLLRMYVAYADVFTDDAEMMHWGAQVGAAIGEHREAGRLFHRAAAVAATELKTKPSDKSLKNIFEGSLLGEIEQAEASKDAGLREAAYNYYLAVNSQGAQAFDVRYQRAHLYYESNRQKQAVGEFHYLATEPSRAHRDLKLKSADLGLDSLVALNDDQTLRSRSVEYARLFPERKAEYLKISRKATMNIVAAGLKNEKSAGRSDYRASLKELNAVNLDGADDAEKIKFLKNKMVVAQKALELSIVGATAAELLRVKTLSDADREAALESQVWAAELQLDFATAYQISLKMKQAKVAPADRELRLALLAELSGRSPRRHNEAFLKLNRNVRAGNLVRVTMVKTAANPWRELEAQLPSLSKTPDLLAALTLDVFADHRDFAKAERVLKQARLERFPAGQTLARQLSLKDFAAFDRKIRAHRVYGYSDAAMGKTLKERIALITDAGKLANEAVKRRDWTMQMLTLSVLARENRRLYRDILALPVPHRLAAADKVRYQQLLKAQSDPYLATAEKIDQQLAQTWNDTSSLQGLQSTYLAASSELRSLYRNEIVQLAQIAPDGAKSRLQTLLTAPFERPSTREISVARQDLKSHPFDVAKAEGLRDLEARRGDLAMSAYLNERINQLKKEVN